MERGANPNCFDEFGITPLFEAVKNCKEEAAQVLYSSGARLGFSIKGKKTEGITDDIDQTFMRPHSNQRDAGSLICQVIADGDLNYLGRLLKFGLPANSADYDGRTGLHLAASLGYVRMIEVMVAAGADINSRDNFGRTPLLEAVRNQQEPAARLLHSRGANFGFLIRTHSAVNAGVLIANRSRLHAGAEMCQAAYEGKYDNNS